MHRLRLGRRRRREREAQKSLNFSLPSLSSSQSQTLHATSYANLSISSTTTHVDLCESISECCANHPMMGILYSVHGRRSCRGAGSLAIWGRTVAWSCGDTDSVSVHGGGVCVCAGVVRANGDGLTFDLVRFAGTVVIIFARGFADPVHDRQL